VQNVQGSLPHCARENRLESSYIFWKQTWETGAGCGAVLGAVHPWWGEAGATLGGGARLAAVVLPCFSAGGGTKAGWARWAKRPSRPVRRFGQLGQKLKEKSIRNKNWIFEFTKALKNCTRRFRRNFGTRIFPKFF
jgi:hypothetical protein